MATRPPRAMRNPLRSEAEMFRFLIGAIAYFALVVIASLLGGAWWGVAVALVLLVPAVLWFMGKIGEPLAEPAEAIRPTAASGKVLLLVPPSAPADGLPESLAARNGIQEIVVVVPALATHVEQVTGAVDDRRTDAQREADAVAGALASRGIRARGEVGADEPLQALEDALRLFGADEIVVAGGDEAFVARAREHFAIPVSRIG